MLFNVTPKKEQELRERMKRCGIQETDLQERFVRSGGPGGQHVNRSATCVWLKHVPSGIEVKMQEARSQALNRFLARRRLCEILEQRLLGKKSPLETQYKRIRKQKARRQRRAFRKTENPSSDGYAS